MNSQKWLWTTFVLLSCWILPFLEAGKKKRSFSSFSIRTLEMLSNNYSNQQQFESVLDPMLVERVPGTPGNTAVQEFIENQMINLGWNITKDSFTDSTPYGPRSFTNIIATLDPRAPKRLVLACHFDSKLMHGIKFVAATDSAVPCAILIDLAIKFQCLFDKALRQLQAPQTTIQLLFLDGEEAFVTWTENDSTYGARHLARLWETTPDPHDSSKTMLETITDFVLLDLIGTSDVSFKNTFEETSELYQKLYKIEAKLNKSNFLTRDNGLYRPYFGNHPVRRMGIEDDHIPFLHRGVNILHLISVPFPWVWHNANDNKSNLDFRAIDNFNRIFRVFVASYLHLDISKNSCRRK